MPELPEVETIVRGLAKRVTGDVIESVWIGAKPEPLKSSAKEIATTLERARIAGVDRLGKHIVMELESSPQSSVRSSQKKQKRIAGSARNDKTNLNGSIPSRAQWFVHLGMTGRLLIAQPEHEIEKHTHLIAKLRSGRELRFIDPRRFGRLSVQRHTAGGPSTALRAGSCATPAWASGTEPLTIDFPAFSALFRKRNTPIKSALLNQKLLRGVGNIYADESLFRAGVRPRRRAGKLNRQELQRLFTSIQKVLREAIAAGGSSVSDYVDAAGEEGFFQLQHRVYGREGEPCLVCKMPIKRIVIAGRSSHYCAKCQR